MQQYNREIFKQFFCAVYLEIYTYKSIIMNISKFQASKIKLWQKKPNNYDNNTCIFYEWQNTKKKKMRKYKEIKKKSRKKWN